ncbi:MAG: four helix bundle protein [Stigonema ocellatum SAG 48.90 = DSM 106950]|nr:four helix bundle protein [Stigonema ocellatum SAG 48.90 = DSM 106950]
MTSCEIRSYQDLEVWQKGMNLAEASYELTKRFPTEELYGMTSQIRRAAVSIPANIAEGYGREYRAEYIQFLRIAQGSLKELETHLILSAKARVGLTTTQAVNPILTQCESVGRLLRALIRSLQKK